MEVREVDTLGTYSREKIDRDGLDGWESRRKLSRRWNCEVAGQGKPKRAALGV